MPQNVKDAVFAIPVESGSYVLGAVGPILERGGRFVLGSAPNGYEALKVQFRGEQNVYCQQLNSNSRDSFETYFEKSDARFRRLDVVVLGDAIWSSADCPWDERIKNGTRTLLTCLDASIPYIRKELHIVLVGPVSLTRVAVQVSKAFLQAKFALTLASTWPLIRVTTVATDAQGADGNALTSVSIPLVSWRQNADKPSCRSRERATMV